MDTDQATSSVVVPQLCPAGTKKKKLILCAQKLPAKVLAAMLMPRLGSNSFALCFFSKGSIGFELQHYLESELQ